jgi:hypothetical protein
MREDSRRGRWREDGGERTVGERTVGERTVGERMVGERMAGERMVGERMVGERMVGERMVGERTVERCCERMGRERMMWGTITREDHDLQSKLPKLSIDIDGLYLLVSVQLW